MQRQLVIGRLTIGRMAAGELGAAAVVVTRAFAGTPEAQSLRDIRWALDVMNATLLVAPACGMALVIRFWQCHAEDI